MLIVVELEWLLMDHCPLGQIEEIMAVLEEKKKTQIRVLLEHQRCTWKSEQLQSKQVQVNYERKYL